MVTISKVGDSTIKFEFTNNDHYLYNNGEISVPLNSLILVTDDTDLVIFKKIDGDVFVTFLIGNSNFSSKAELINFYKENMVDGGGSDITSGDVQSMIDESISGKADSSAVTEEISAAVSGKVDTSSVVTAVTSGSTDSEIPTAKAVFDAIPTGGTGGGKAISAGTNISVTTGETADTVSCTLPITLTKQRTSTYGDSDNLTIFNLNKTNEIKHTGTTDNIIIGHNNNIGNNFDPSKNNFILGNYNNLNQGISGNDPNFNFIVGDYNTIGKSYSENVHHTALFGTYLTPKNNYEYDFGKYNNSVSGSSTFGDSGNTLFSVGNGTADNARHNAFEIRQNGDIYCSDGTNDVKLQDTITATAANTTALGGLKLVKLTQSEYDNLATKDNSTLYIIV